MASGVDPLAGQTSGAGSTAQTGSNSSAAAAKTDPLAQKDTFLKLLVAQIKNQDPLNPTDGVQFLTQLTQFSELEQIIQIRTDLDGIGQSLKQNQNTADTSSENSAATETKP